MYRYETETVNLVLLLSIQGRTRILRTFHSVDELTIFSSALGAEPHVVSHGREDLLIAMQPAVEGGCARSRNYSFIPLSAPLSSTPRLFFRATLLFEYPVTCPQKCLSTVERARRQICTQAKSARAKDLPTQRVTKAASCFRSQSTAPHLPEGSRCMNPLHFLHDGSYSKDLFFSFPYHIQIHSRIDEQLRSVRQNLSDF